MVSFKISISLAAILACAIAGHAAAQQGRDVALTGAEEAALAELSETNAVHFPLIDSWYQQRPMQYYDFGPTVLQPIGLYRVDGGSDVISSIPGLRGYSHLVQLFTVLVAPGSGIDPATLTSREKILALVPDGKVRLVAGGVRNLPVVPAGSTLERDPENRPLREALYKGKTVHYYDFGASRVASIPLAAFASSINADGELVRVEGQPSNGSAVPGVPGYSDMWGVTAFVGPRIQPGSYRDYRRALADARAGRLKTEWRGIRNCPVMYVDGKPASRPGRDQVSAPALAGNTPSATSPVIATSGPTGTPAVVPVSTQPVTGAAANAYYGTATRTAVQTPRITADVVVDGALDEAAWGSAARLAGFSQYQPVDGRPADDSTDVLVWYSPTAIHFGIKAYESHGAVHATLASRDRIAGDDYIQIILDTFNDRRRALVFGVNPLGIQSDGTLTEGSQARTGGGVTNTGGGVRDTVDLSADFVYQSKGRLTPWGYEVEVSIPFKTLRYQPTAVQTWGFNVVRKVQHSGYENTWTPARQANTSFLGQSGTLEGLTGISRGLVLDVNPELTGKTTGTPVAGGWQYTTSTPEVGGNVRWGVTNNLTFAGTVNPDFSQVEADVQQVIADPRSAVNYPEKRPFFLEGAEQFDTPNQLIYTRRLVAPVTAVKLSGKMSGTGLGLLVGADDKSLSTSHVDNPYYGMFRVRRDLGTQSSLGIVSTTRIDGSNYSQLASLDSRLTFAKKWTAQLQGAETITRTGTSTVTGPMWQGNLDRAGRSYRFNYTMSGFHPNFVAAAGFQRRINIATASMTHRWILYGKRGATIESFTFDWNYSANWWYKYNNRFLNGMKPNDPKFHLTGNLALKGGWRVGGATYFEYFSYDPTLFTTYRIERTLSTGVKDTIPYTGTQRLYNIDLVFNLATPQFKKGAATLSVITGQDENFFEWSSAWIWLITATADIRPTDKIRLNARYVRQLYLRKTDGSTVGDRQIPRLKVEYQLTRAIFLRFVGQYDIQQRDSLRDDSRTNFPILMYDAGRRTYSRAGIVNSNNLRVDWLFSFQPNPGTVLFAGYGSSLTETDAFTFRDIRRTGDGFFVKLSYLLRL